MDQWTNGLMNQGTNGPMDKKFLRPYEKKNTLGHWNIGTLDHWNIGTLKHLNIWTFALNQHLVTSVALILFERLRVTLVTSIASMDWVNIWKIMKTISMQNGFRPVQGSFAKWLYHHVMLDMIIMWWQLWQWLLWLQWLQLWQWCKMVSDLDSGVSLNLRSGSQTGRQSSRWCLDDEYDDDDYDGDDYVMMMMMMMNDSVTYITDQAATKSCPRDP